MTLSGSWFNGDAESLRLLAEETAVLEATELVAECLEHRHVNRAGLASRLGVSRSEITQRLSGKRNLSVRTLGAMFHELGYRLRFDAEDLAHASRPVPHRIHVADPSPWTETTPRYTQTGTRLRVVKGAA